MYKQDTPKLAPSITLHNSRDAIRNAAVSIATPEIKIPPIIFCQQWDTPLWYNHLADLADLTPIWTDLVAAGRDEFQHFLDDTCCTAKCS